jgi:hypothetical protein
MRPENETFKQLTADFYSPFSFPSGHATLISTYWGYLSARLKKAQNAIFFLAVVLVGLSRVYLGVHFLSDVVTGTLLGLLLGIGILQLKKKPGIQQLKPTKLLDSLVIAVVVGASLLALLFIENLPLAASLIGFFGGFFLCKEISFDAPLLKGKPLLAKEAIGFLVIILVFALLPVFTKMPLPFGWGQHGQTRAFLTYAFLGLWASFIWPLAYQKIFNNLQKK